MNLLELKIKVDRALEMNKENEHCQVVILNNKKGYGVRGNTKVKYANLGFDWERGLFLMTPETELNEVVTK